MLITSTDIVIERPRNQVFDFAVDPANSTLWHMGLIEMRAEAGMPTGSAGELITQVMGRRIVSRFEMIENDGIGRTHAKSSHGPLKYETIQIFESLSTGRTRVIIQVKIDASIVFRLAEPTLETMAHSQIEFDVSALKAILESDKTSPSPEASLPDIS